VSVIRFLSSLLAIIVLGGQVADRSDFHSHADKLASLIDPAKLATLRERGAKPSNTAAVLSDEMI